MEKKSPSNEQPNLVEGNDLRGSPEEEYILKWTDHKVNFFSLAAADLFNEEDLTDVTICCGEKLFDAHKLILSACSPYFKSMLTHKKKLNKVTMSSSVASSNEASSSTSGCCHSHLSQMHPIIFLKDVPPSDFERLLQFMYHGEVRVPNEDLESLILTAKSLKVKGLSASALPSSLTQPLTSQSIPETHEECGEDLSTKSRKPIGTIKHKEKITNKHHNNHTPPKKRRISASSLHALSVNNHHDFDKEQVDENIEHPTPPTLTTTSPPNHHSNNHPFSGHPDSQSHRSILSNTAERFSHHREHHHKLRSSISTALISEMASDRILSRRMSPTRPNTSPSPSSPSTRPMTANSFISSIRRQPLTPPPTNCGNIIGRSNNAIERRERLAPLRHSSGHQLCSTTTPRTNSSKKTSNSKQISHSTGNKIIL